MRTDILLDDNYDRIILNGDFLTGISDNQNIKLIILAHQGEWKQYPSCGIGIRDYINGTMTSNLARIISGQLNNDGYSDTKVTMKNDGQITIS